MPTPRPNRDEDPRRAGAEDYDRFLSILRGELDRVIDPLQKAINETREDVRALRKETYTREIMDEKLKGIQDQLTDHEKDIRSIRSLIGNSWKELLERLGVLAGIAYAAIYVIHSLFH